MTDRSTPVEPDRRLARLASLVTETVRQGTAMDVAFLARWVDGALEVRAVSSAEDAEGWRALADLSCTAGLCRASVAGTDAVVVGDTASAGTRPAAAAHRAGVGAFLGLPLQLPDGRSYGTLCAASAGGRPALGAKEADLMKLIGASVTSSVWAFGQRQALEETRAGLLAGAAHDLQTPLRAVVMLAEDLASGIIEPAQAEELLHACTREITGLVDVVLEAASASAPDTDFQPERCDLVGLVEEVVRTAEAAEHARRVQIASPERLEASVDREHLRRAAQNLVGNALKYSPRGTTVHVRLAEDAGVVRLEVEDEGDGIPAPDIARLTERFFRSSGAIRSGEEGHGLGLATVKLVADLHGGRLDVRSVPGEGSTFMLTLPLAGLS